MSICHAGLTNDGNGLYFKVTKTGSTSWIFRYKINYKSRDMGQGPYPAVGLADAREQAARSSSFLAAIRG
ncbi:hypothetical protein CK507_01370 [Pseudomonas sp. WN033]|nr:hypothetical protein CK507_01370 [Pseudomonas sp. WN033]